MATYKELIKLLNQELQTRKIDHKKLKDHELSVYNLVTGRSNMAQFNLDSGTILFSRGDYNKGLEHILIRHYCKCCDGWVNAKNIIFMGRVFFNGRKMTDHEVKDEYTFKPEHFSDSYEKGKEGYVMVLDNIQYFVIYAEDHTDRNKKVITYYTDRLSRCDEENEEIIAEPIALH